MIDSTSVSVCTLGSVPDFINRLRGVKLEHNRFVGGAVDHEKRALQSTSDLAQRRRTTVISDSTQTALCTLIGATTVSSSITSWQCTTSGTVVTQPCNGGTAVWTGITCNGYGEVTAISLASRAISGSN